MTRGFSIVVTRAGGGRASRNEEQWSATARKHAILADCAHDSCSAVHRRSRPCTAMHCHALPCTTSAIHVNCLCQDSRTTVIWLCCACRIGDTLPVVCDSVCNTVCKTVYCTVFCTVCCSVCCMRTFLFITIAPSTDPRLCLPRFISA